MGRENQGSVLKTVIKFTEPIKIDGNTVNMPVTLTFNEEKGTGVINLQLSTKMLSADKSQRDLVFLLAERLLRDAYSEFWEKYVEYETGHRSGDPNQLTIDHHDTPEEIDAAIVNFSGIYDED